MNIKDKEFENKLKQATFLKKTFDWNIIPVSKDKKPLITWKAYQELRISEKQLTDWLKQFPEANLGVVTGKISNLIVIDIDPRHKGTDEEFKNINTIKVKSGGGGWHYYFLYQAGIPTKSNLKEGIDIKSHGGFFIIPPSLH